MLSRLGTGALVGFGLAAGCADVLAIRDVPVPASDAAVPPEDASVSADAGVDASLTDAPVADGPPADASHDAGPCIPGLPCSPESNPCDNGATICAGGIARCSDLGTAAPTGTECSTYDGGICLSGACQCPQETTACGGACANLQTDGVNCGRCGHGCQGGLCAAGVCQPFALVPETVLKSLMVNPIAIASDGTTVYFSSDTFQVPGMYQVWSVPAGKGGEPKNIAQGQPGLNNLAIGPGALYWSNYGNPLVPIANFSATFDGAIIRYPFGGTPAPVITGLSNPGRIVIDRSGTFAYVPSLGPYDGMGFADQAHGYITEMLLDAGGPLAADAAIEAGAIRTAVVDIDYIVPQPDQVAIGGGVLFWLTGDATSPSLVFDLTRAVAANGLKFGMDHYYGEVTRGLEPVATETAVYWLTSASDTNNGPSTGGVWTLPATASVGTVSATPLAAGQNYPQHLVIDGSNAYWWSQSNAADGGPGLIMQAPLDGSRVATSLAQTVGLVDGVALDGTSIYWTDSADGIEQLAKP
jgi:hypothetical protein